MFINLNLMFNFNDIFCYLNYKRNTDIQVLSVLLLGSGLLGLAGWRLRRR